MNREFKVAKILDKYSVVINGGEKEIIKGDIFEIYIKDVVQVIDPDTKEILGTYDFVKATIAAVEVDAKMTKCVNVEKSGALNGFASVLKELSTTTVSELNVDYDAMTDDFETVDRVIRIGDLVRLVKRTGDTSAISASLKTD